MRIVVLAALLSLVLSMVMAGVAQSDDDDDGRVFTARLVGANEVPAVSTVASGRLRVTAGQNTLNYVLSYEDFEAQAPATAAHIHFAQANVNGGVIAFLCGGGDKPPCPPTGGTVTGSIDAADIIGPANQGIAPGEFAEARQALLRGLVYGNVHSQTRFPGGEIRGQLARQRR